MTHIQFEGRFFKNSTTISLQGPSLTKLLKRQYWNILISQNVQYIMYIRRTTDILIFTYPLIILCNIYIYNLHYLPSRSRSYSMTFLSTTLFIFLLQWKGDVPLRDPRKTYCLTGTCITDLNQSQITFIRLYENLLFGLSSFFLF